MEEDDKAPPSSGHIGFSVDPRFSNLRPIGHGGNAVVYAATDSDCDKEVAIKKLSFCDLKSCKYTLREIKIMRRLQHENIVTVYEVLGSNGCSLEKGGVVNTNLREMSCVYIVQELLHTDLHQLIQLDQLTQEHIKLFTYQLLRGLKYIHSANVLHRDLKPMNLLVNVEDLVLKIADFGLARVLDNDYSHKGFLTDNVGTCWYRSPELVISPRDYTKAIDVWSVGCILAEMLCGKPLFTGGHEMDQIGQILDTVHLSDNEWNKVTQILPTCFIQKHSRKPSKPLHERFINIDIDALDLLEQLLVFDPVLRITVEDALAHPYLQQYSCVEDEPIVLTPFHIEHEVDELSPKSSRRNMAGEMMKLVEGCGSVPGQPPDISITMSRLEQRPNNNNTVANNRAASGCGRREEAEGTGKIAACGVTMSGDGYIEDFLPDIVEDKNKNVTLPSNKGNVMDDELIISRDSRQYPRDRTDGFNDSAHKTGSGLEKQLKHLQIVVNIPEDEENLKEQISPKENKDSGSEKNKLAKESANVDKLIVKVDYIQPKRKASLPKSKDIVNEERRAESPRTSLDRIDRIDIMRIEKEKFKTTFDKFRNNKKEKKKKKNRRNNRGNSNDDSQDFDSLYRLPTEHLTRHRNSICGKDRGVKTVEEQLRLHEELNERRKMVEMEKETYVGAVGGYYCEMEENSLNLRSSHAQACGNSSPTSEHSRDSSPSNDEGNLPRRFER